MTRMICMVLLVTVTGCAGPGAAPPTVERSHSPHALVTGTDVIQSRSPLTPRTSATEEQRLLEDTRRAISEADRLLGRVSKERLAGAERELLLTAQNLLSEARRALVAREYQRAATLATKARVLGDDLATKVDAKPR